MPRRLSCIISVLIQTTIFGHNKKNVVDANNIIISIINSRSRSFATLQCSTATKDSPTKAPDWLFYYSDYPTIIGRPANKVSRMGIFPLPQNQHNKTYNTHLHLFCWLPKTTQISMIAFVCVWEQKSILLRLPPSSSCFTHNQKQESEGVESAFTTTTLWVVVGSQSHLSYPIIDGISDKYNKYILYIY